MRARYIRLCPIGLVGQIPSQTDFLNIMDTDRSLASLFNLESHTFDWKAVPENARYEKDVENDRALKFENWEICRCAYRDFD
jgi:hypothetical protein